MWLYHGGPGGLRSSPIWSADGDRAWAHFGSVSFAGDVNGDGAVDAVIGAPNWSNDPDQGGEGIVYLYEGVPTARFGPGVITKGVAD